MTNKINFAQLQNKKLLFIWTSVLTVAYLIVLFTFQVEFPVNNDDLVVEVQDVSRYIDGEMSAISYISGIKNHPSVVHRMVCLTVYHITGKISFASVRIIANMLFIIFTLFLTWYYREHIAAWVIPLLLLTPCAAMVHWGSAAAVYPFPLMFLFLILIGLPKADTLFRRILLILLLPLMAFSLGNGVIGLLMLFPFVLYLVSQKRINKIYAAVFLLAVSICVGLFVNNLGVTTINSYAFNFDVFSFPFAFCGNLMNCLPIPSIWPSVLFSLSMLVFIIPVFVKHWKSNDVMIWVTMIGMLFISGLAAGISRCQDSYFCTPTVYRYEIMGVFAAVCGFLLLGKYYKRSLPYLFIGLLALSIVNYKEAINKLQRVTYIETRKSYKIFFLDEFYIKSRTIEKTQQNEEVYRNGIKRNLILMNQPSGFDVDLAVACSCDDLEDVSFKVTGYGTNKGMSYFEGVLNKQAHAQLYIRYEKSCYPINLRFHPRAQRNRTFYAIIPEMNERAIKLYHE